MQFYSLGAINAPSWAHEIMVRSFGGGAVFAPAGRGNLGDVWFVITSVSLVVMEMGKLSRRMRGILPSIWVDDKSYLLCLLKLIQNSYCELNLIADHAVFGILNNSSEIMLEVPVTRNIISKIILC